MTTCIVLRPITRVRLRPPRLLSQHFRTHAEDYRRTKSAIPRAQVFDTLTQRLKMAVAANSTPPTVGLWPRDHRIAGQLRRPTTPR